MFLVLNDPWFYAFIAYGIFAVGVTAIMCPQPARVKKAIIK
jgi:hypothetical protein